MIKVEICMGTRCTLVGAIDILDRIEELQDEYPDAGIDIITTKCPCNCKEGQHKLSPLVKVNGKILHNTTCQQVMAEIMEYVEIEE